MNTYKSCLSRCAACKYDNACFPIFLVISLITSVMQVSVEKTWISWNDIINSNLFCLVGERLFKLAKVHMKFQCTCYCVLTACFLFIVSCLLLSKQIFFDFVLIWRSKFSMCRKVDFGISNKSFKSTNLSSPGMH